MRPESTDLQGNHRSDSPTCANCGLPLAHGVTVCPFCARNVADEPAGAGRAILGVSERTVLYVAAAALALAGIVTAAVAIFS